MAVRNVPPTESYNAPGTSTGRRDRSFATLYEQARRAAANDSGARNDEAAQAAVEAATDQNRKYIATLHDRMDTLRGELIVRVIQAGQGDHPLQVTSDVSRLSNRLDSLRRKLETEEVRLSGKLIDLEA